MAEGEGTFSRLSEISEARKPPKEASRQVPQSEARPEEDINIVPYISQNYRFTEDELRWIRRQAYDLTERIGIKVSQNTVLRIALHFLRKVCTENPESNPLLDSVSQLKK